jgi:hypothetical protein
MIENLLSPSTAIQDKISRDPLEILDSIRVSRICLPCEVFIDHIFLSTWSSNDSLLKVIIGRLSQKLQLRFKTQIELLSQKGMA